MKSISRKELCIFTLPLLIGTAVFVVCVYMQFNQLINVAEFFQKNMRASLFAGFLTMGSFLLSLKTGIVIKIKENVYDKEVYQEQVDEAQAEGLSTTVYGPLKRLSRMLSTAVFASLLAATLQLTLGLHSSWWAAATCLSAASIALTFLLTAFALIQLNLATWFNFLEDEAEKAKEKRASKKQSAQSQ
jgi:hypothetical protein